MSGGRGRERVLVAAAVGFWVVGWTSMASLAQGPAEVLSASFRKAAQRVQPAVVAVRAEGSRPVLPMVLPRRGPFGPGPIVPPVVARSSELEREPGGSGLVIDAERGHILTTDQVLQGSAQAVVVLPDGRERLTSQIRRDPRSDLALLIVEPQGLSQNQVTWGDAAALEPGDWVIALGQPGGSAPTMSAGIVSAHRRVAGVGGAAELIETDAAIHRFNSGGPLVNLKGAVVGINKQGARRQDGLEGMGWAIPADRARRVAEQLARFGQVRRGYLGIQVEPVDPATGQSLNQPGAVVIAGVNPGSPATLAGLSPGDVILRVGLQPIQGVAMLQELVEQAPIEEELSLTVARQGRRLEVKVRPQAMPGPVGVIGPARAGGSALVETRRDREPGRLRSRGPQAVPRAVPRRESVPDPQPPPEPAPTGRGQTTSPPLEPPQPQPEPPPR
jgi:serine protease Do